MCHILFICLNCALRIKFLSCCIVIKMAAALCRPCLLRVCGQCDLRRWVGSHSLFIYLSLFYRQPLTAVNREINVPVRRVYAAFLPMNDFSFFVCYFKSKNVSTKARRVKSESEQFNTGQ